MTEDVVEILLVEDNPNDVELTLHAFRKYHLTNRMQVVSDGEEALDFIFCRGQFSSRNILNGPRVVLLDIKLPKVDGLEVLRQVKADERTRKIPVVLLTSSREERDILAGYTNGANSYIVKPVDFEQFTESVRTLGMYWLLLNKPPLID
jgi:two-component system response regulator